MLPVAPGVYRRAARQEPEAQRLTLAAVLLAWGLAARAPAPTPERKRIPSRRDEALSQFPPAARRLAR